ncbi:MAG: hypothetical protein QM689_08230 [Oscillospiraceae bacterium]
MNIQTAILREESEFPKRFAAWEETEYGLLFYMDDNHDSYDGNHAFLFPENITDLGAVLDDIRGFYLRRGITPVIYHPHQQDYFNLHKETLAQHGFSFTPEEPHRVMILSAENRIQTDKRLDIRLLTEWDERIAADILLPGGEPWEIAPAKQMMKAPGSFLYAGYLGETAMVYTNIHSSPYGNTRFDYIVTAKAHRGMGYASELLSFVVDDCKRKELPVCWQWAGPSEHITYRAGFRESFSIPAGYAKFDAH